MVVCSGIWQLTLSVCAPQGHPGTQLPPFTWYIHPCLPVFTCRHYSYIHLHLSGSQCVIKTIHSLITILFLGQPGYIISVIYLVQIFVYPSFYQHNPYTWINSRHRFWTRLKLHNVLQLPSRLFHFGSQGHTILPLLVILPAAGSNFLAI